MRGPRLMRWSSMILLVAIVFSASNAVGSTISVGIGAFGPGSTLTTFTGLADGTEVNGLTVNGILFNYSLGNGQVQIGVGPGTTNNMAPPNVVSVGDNTGVLSMTLPSFVDTFGYGYAVLSTAAAVTAATTISLFSGATPVGSLSYNGVPDPLFSGGFAGIESTIPFNSVRVTFNSVAAPAFALDNIRTATTNVPVPEPSTLLLLGAGITVLVLFRRTRKGV
jgi:PEP-CTERM motif-containing protein